MNKQIENAQQNYDLEKAAELQYGKLPQLQKQLEAGGRKGQRMKIFHWYMKV